MRCISGATEYQMTPLHLPPAYFIFILSFAFAVVPAIAYHTLGPGSPGNPGKNVETLLLASVVTIPSLSPYPQWLSLSQLIQLFRCSPLSALFVKITTITLTGTIGFNRTSSLLIIVFEYAILAHSGACIDAIVRRSYSDVKQEICYGYIGRVRHAPVGKQCA